MINKIKEVTLPQWFQAVLVAALVSAGGLLYAQVDKNLDKKANNETIIMYMAHQEEQRKEDCQREKEKFTEQQRKNELYDKAIQQLLIKMAKDK